MIQLCSPDNVPVILASASPRRVALLDQIGLQADEIIPADIDESNLKTELPLPYAKRMAFEKTTAIAKLRPDAFVIGADTVVACGRRILPKASDKQTAQECLRLLMGRAHRVYGGIALYNPTTAKITVKATFSHVHMRRLDHKECDEYLHHGDWDGKAGGYAIQGAAAEFITKIQGSYSQIMGLDIYLMAKLLKQAGFTKQVRGK